MRQIKDNAQCSGACLIATKKTQKDPEGAETIAACGDECDIADEIYWAELAQQVEKCDRNDDQDHSHDQFGD